jgi:hypothetical protein
VCLQMAGMLELPAVLSARERHRWAGASTHVRWCGGRCARRVFGIEETPTSTPTTSSLLSEVPLVNVVLEGWRERMWTLDGDVVSSGAENSRCCC